MKVIIQDVSANGFLAGKNCWVADKSDAKDFVTLMRAYQFAQATLAGAFRVLLHFPEDGYSACIIEGTGVAPASPTFQLATPARETSRINGHEAPEADFPMTELPARGGLSWPGRFGSGRTHLN